MRKELQFTTHVAADLEPSYTRSSMMPDDRLDEVGWVRDFGSVVAASAVGGSLLPGAPAETEGSSALLTADLERRGSASSSNIWLLKRGAAATRRCTAAFV